MGTEIKRFQGGSKCEIKSESLRLRIADFHAELLAFHPEGSEFTQEKEDLTDRCKALYADLTLQTSDLSTQLEDKLLEACGYFGSYSDACTAVVENFQLIHQKVY